MDFYRERIGGDLVRNQLGTKYNPEHSYFLIEDAGVFTLEDGTTGEQFPMYEATEFDESKMTSMNYASIDPKLAKKAFISNLILLFVMIILFLLAVIPVYVYKYGI